MWNLLLAMSPVNALAASPNPPVEQPAPQAPIEQADPAAPRSSLVVDCKVPAELVVDGVQLGELRFPGTLGFAIPAGHHVVRVYVGGTPTELQVDALPGQPVHVLAGRTGVSLAAADAAPTPDTVGQVQVAMRVVGVPAVQLRLDDGRHVLQTGADTTFTLSTGTHRLSVRSADGTAIWSTGILDVQGAAVVQLTEGRLPEVSGGAVFHAGS